MRVPLPPVSAILDTVMFLFIYLFILTFVNQTSENWHFFDNWWGWLVFIFFVHVIFFFCKSIWWPLIGCYFLFSHWMILWVLILYLLPWWLVRLSVSLQCGRPGFDPWVGKIPWRRKWQPTPVLLPGESHGGRRLVDYSPWGRKE